MVNYRESLAALKPYSVEEGDWRIKLDANESPYNLPPLVQERVINRLSFLAFSRYPDMGMTGLKELIAADYQVSTENIVIGSGSSEILEKLCFVFGGAERSIVFPSPSFSMYGIYALMADSKAVPVALGEGFSLSRTEILRQAGETGAGLILLCRPNNPTGTVMPLEDVEFILENAPCPVVVDEAYQEFYDGESAVSLLKKYANLIVARTFSKAYGLASARVGYMLAAKELASLVEKAMMPYHVNALSLATAEIVYQMKDEFAPGIAQLVSERERVRKELEKITELTVFESATNFLLIKTAKAAALQETLAKQGISIRAFGDSGPLTGCIRISMGTPEENDEFLQAVKAFFA